jgi:ParB-like chromosome segregation protein Spo0J
VSTLNVLPALDQATEDALRASIQRFGVLVPILRDQHGDLVDGHHRQRISAEEDKACPEQTVHLPDDPEERAAALVSVNDDRRPRLGVEQRREVVAALRGEGHSQRAVAEALGVGLGTVQRDEEELTRAGQLDVPERIAGQDGKSYPAHKKPHGNDKLTDSQREEIVQRRHRGESGRALAAEFAVAESTISNLTKDSRTRRNRKGSDVKSLEGMAGAAAALAASLGELDAARILEYQDAADVSRWVRDLNSCRVALGPVIKSLNGGKLP